MNMTPVDAGFLGFAIGVLLMGFILLIMGPSGD